MDVLKSTIREREEERKAQKDALKEAMMAERGLSCVIADAEMRAGEKIVGAGEKGMEIGG